MSRLTKLLLSTTLLAMLQIASSPAQDKLANHRMASDLFDKATASMDSGNFAAAADLLTQACQLDEAYGRAHANLGWALMKLGKLDQAIPELQKATSMEPQLPQPWSNLGAASVATGNLPQAIEAYEHYVKIAPDSPERSRAEQNIGLMKKELKSGNKSQTDYVAAATEKNGRLIWKFPHMPIKVYIDQGEGVPGYRPEFAAQLHQAFVDWANASGGRISYVKAATREQADICCDWTNDPSKLRLLGEGGQALWKANTVSGLQRADVLIMTAQTDPYTPLTPQMMSWVTHHEVGHALGIHGHSPDVHDVMFFAGTPMSATGQISQRDANTITRLYSGQ